MPVRFGAITTFAALLLGALLRIPAGEAMAASTTQVNATAKVAICGNGTREGGEHCDGVDLGGVSCPGVGFDGGALSCLAPCEYGFSACTTAATRVDAVTISAATGGQHTLTNPDGTFLTVYVPAWFDEADALMLVFSYPHASIEATKPPPVGQSFVGRAYGVRFIDQDGATLTTLLQPATMMIGYAHGDANGLDEATLIPYRRPDGAGAWQALAGAVVDGQAGNVTFSTSSLSLFAAFASPQASSPGGSSGGGGNSRPPSLAPVTHEIATLSGKAYPGGVVTLLEDGRPIATAAADGAAAFTITGTLSGPGAHALSLYADDANGARSTTLMFPVIAPSGSTSVFGDIFFPPTIEADALDVRQGESIRISGRSVPNGEIAVTRGLGGDSVTRVRTNSDGTYEFRLDTSSVEAGEYVLRVKAELEKRVSSYGRSIRLIVRTRTFPFSLPTFVPRTGSARSQEAASSVAVVDLSRLAAPIAPTREVFSTGDEDPVATPAAKPARRSFVARLFGWLAGLFRAVLAIAMR